MDPVSLIVAALAAGAAAVGRDLASSAMKDGYSGLKSLLVTRLRRTPDRRPSASPSGVDPVAVLQSYEDKPDSWKAPLEDTLRDAGADRDQEILAAAKALLEQLDPQGAASGKYQLDLRGAQGVQVGDHGQMTVTFGAAAPRPVGPSQAE
jgi:hypothetical protein